VLHKFDKDDESLREDGLNYLDEKERWNTDWPEKFSGQSEGGISNAPGTFSVRVNAQGLSGSCCELSPMEIPSPQLAAPGSPRMTAYCTNETLLKTV